MVAAGHALLAAATALAPALDSRVFFSGGIAAAITHTVSVPIDVVKTRIQLEPVRFNAGPVSAAQVIVSEEGAKGLLSGAGPTFIGYFVQGSVKFGLYDALKPIVAAAASELEAPRLAVLVCAAVAAECVASTALCPLEAARIRKVQDPSSSANTMQALRQLFQGPEWQARAFGGLGPILLKQCPYTAGKLATYEFARGSAAPLLGAEGVSSFGAQLACAFLAAIVSSVLSQPGDSLLSEVNRSNVAASIARRGAALGQGSGVLVLARRLGLRGLFRGTGARLVQMTLVVVLQLLIYDSVRQLCGLSPLGT